MPPAYTPPRSSSAALRLILGAAILIIGVTGTIGLLIAVGVEIPFLSSKRVTAQSTEGKVAVPITARSVSAYAKVGRDDLIDPKEMKIKAIYLDPHEVGPEVLVDLNKILGRVLKQEKRAGYAFTEKDFYPAGTPAGVTAGIPPGKRSFVLEADKVHGIADLRQGDHFDILAAVEVDDKRGNLSPVAPNMTAGNPLVASTSTATTSVKKVVLSVPVVQNGVVVVPATARQVPVAGAAPGNNGQPKTKTAQDVTIAVELDEVGWVTEAITVRATLTCVARSGHPVTSSKDELGPIPVAARSVPAYTKVTKNHLFDPLIRSIAAIYLRAEHLDVPPDAIRDMSQIVGRVLRHEKPAGAAFTEADFYPVGTPAGVGAAVPPGKRSFVFDSEKVQGVATLRQGDRFDIVSTTPVDDKPAPNQGTKSITIGVSSPSAKQAVVKPVVQNGTVLIPVTSRVVPGATGPSKTVQEITVAIDPEEVAHLTEALAVQTGLTCVARSGHPSDQRDKDVPEKPVDVKVTTIETLIGGRREVIQFTEPARSQKSPSVPTK